MERTLFITNRNMLTACGEMRLIKNRAEMLYKYGNIRTDFIVINSNARFDSATRESIENAGEIVECGYKSKAFIMKSVWQAGKEIERKLRTGKYSTVILSGTMVYRFASDIKHRYKNIKILLDIHGASEDMLEIAANSKWVKRYALRALYQYEVKYLGKAVGYCDGFLVVTEELQKYLVEKYPDIKGKKFYRVPCACNQGVLSQDAYSRFRETYRKKYGITDEIVFLYSGGVSNWQCVDEAINLYKQIDKTLEKKTKMLIFSYKAEKIKSLIGEDKRFLLDSYTPDELGKALCAGDFALLLRKKSLTNQVAFPNKFLEYAAGGMKIITTPYVKEVANQVRRFNLGYIYDFHFDKKIVEYIENTKISYDRNLIENVLNYNSYEQCLRKLIQDITKKEYK